MPARLGLAGPGRAPARFLDAPGADERTFVYRADQLQQGVTELFLLELEPSEKHDAKGPPGGTVVTRPL